jgi:hypothetical protein
MVIRENQGSGAPAIAGVPSFPCRRESSATIRIPACAGITKNPKFEMSQSPAVQSLLCPKTVDYLQQTSGATVSFVRFQPALKQYVLRVLRTGWTINQWQPLSSDERPYQLCMLIFCVRASDIRMNDDTVPFAVTKT